MFLRGVLVERYLGKNHLEGDLKALSNTHIEEKR